MPKTRISKKIVRAVSPRHAKTKKRLINAYNEKCFWLYNGSVLSNLEDLCRALGSMSDKQFWHHVSRVKNDFAIWVEEVLADKKCADGLRNAATRPAARKAVEKALKDYAI